MTARLSNTLFNTALWLVILTQSACGQAGETALSREDKVLTERMSTATVPEIKAFVREVLDTPLPDDFATPEYIIAAGSPNDATKAIGEHFPEFVDKEGPEFLSSIAADPVRYREMIRHSRALRRHYHNEIYSE
jgi:hypothetical protein